MMSTIFQLGTVTGIGSEEQIVPFGSFERQYRDATNSQLRGSLSSGTPGTSPEDELGMFPIGEVLAEGYEAASPVILEAASPPTSPRP